MYQILIFIILFFFTVACNSKQNNVSTKANKINHDSINKPDKKNTEMTVPKNNSSLNGIWKSESNLFISIKTGPDELYLEVLKDDGEDLSYEAEWFEDKEKTFTYYTDGNPPIVVCTILSNNKIHAKGYDFKKNPIPEFDFIWTKVSESNSYNKQKLSPGLLYLINNDDTEVKVNPEKDSPYMNYLYKGDIVRLLEIDEKWCKIRSKDKTSKGWVESISLSPLQGSLSPVEVYVEGIIEPAKVQETKIAD